MDVRKIKKLIELLEDSALTEMEITEGEESIRLCRAVSVTTSASQSFSVPLAAPAGPESIASGAAAAITVAPAEKPDGHPIRSPMVGTYYASPSPDTKAFAEVGREVRAGDPLCIIEAMKIFNQIEADRGGIVRTIFKENGDPVEYGEILFILK